MEKFKDLFRSPKKPRPEPIRQYTYPRGDPASRQLFPNPPSVRTRDDTFRQKYDEASDEDRTGFLNWKKAFTKYNKALAEPRLQKRILREEKASEEKQLAHLKAEVMRCYGRLDSKVLVEAYRRLPEEKASYEAFCKEYPALTSQFVNHTEVHARVGPAYIHSPSFGKKQTLPPQDESPSKEVIARAKISLERRNRERDERERWVEAERAAIRYKSTRLLPEYAPKANEKRKIIAPSQPIITRKPVPGSATGSVRTTSAVQKQYKAYKPAREEFEPNPFSHRGLRVNNSEEEQGALQRSHRRHHEAAMQLDQWRDFDGVWQSAGKPDSQLSSRNGGPVEPSRPSRKDSRRLVDQNARVPPSQHHAKSYLERERRLQRTQPQPPPRHPTHYKGRELDYSHRESSSDSSRTPLHPALREANTPRQGKRSGGTHLDYQSRRRPPSPTSSIRLTPPNLYRPQPSQAIKHDEQRPRAADSRSRLNKPLPSVPKESQIPRTASKQRADAGERVHHERPREHRDQRNGEITGQSQRLPRTKKDEQRPPWVQYF